MEATKTERASEVLRARTVDRVNNKILITNFLGTDQEQDLTEPPNCNGFGRIRHFRRIASPGWPPNPLPIDPAAKKLGILPTDICLAQVFQNASCNWRCWYCFVPFASLSANLKYSSWLSAAELVALYQREPRRPGVIDLTGGQPDLTPEWIPWMMRELKKHALDRTTFLWSDDNLSNNYFWRYLTKAEINEIENYKNYGKVCCFKGFDAYSFSFNTKAEPLLFDSQFEHFARYHRELNIDLYAYATFTSDDDADLQHKMARFVDRLQEIHVNLPLRVVPLEVSNNFAPTQKRVQSNHIKALSIQKEAIAYWLELLGSRFSPEMRSLRICDVPM
jgi:organic radical activating enzyme